MQLMGSHGRGDGRPPTWAWRLADPDGADLAGDATAMVSRRAIARIAGVAAEVGARFQREGRAADPVGWMLSPRRLFGGMAAIDACLARDPFRRAVLLHALAIGDDADPREVDALLAIRPSTVGAAACGCARPCGCSDLKRGIAAPAVADEAVAVIGTFAPRRVHSATVAVRADGMTTIAFHARLASSTAEVTGYAGRNHPDPAVVMGRVGFDVGHPLLSSALVTLMADADRWEEGAVLEVDIVVRRSWGPAPEAVAPGTVGDGATAPGKQRDDGGCHG